MTPDDARELRNVAKVAKWLTDTARRWTHADPGVTLARVRDAKEALDAIEARMRGDET